jgi:hypothetical protein
VIARSTIIPIDRLRRAEAENIDAAHTVALCYAETECAENPERLSDLRLKMDSQVSTFAAKTEGLENII